MVLSTTSCFPLQIPSDGEADDTEILDLQERANRLLLREYDVILAGFISFFLIDTFFSDFPLENVQLMDQYVQARKAWDAQISLLQPATMSSSKDLSFLELRYLKTNVCINIDMSAFSVYVCTDLLLLLCCVFIHLCRESQVRLRASCVLPEIFYPSFFGKSTAARGRHLVPVAFTEKDGTGQGGSLAYAAHQA